MLLGEYEHTIDDKNRLTLPAQFRHGFADGIVVTRGMDGCLFAYTRADWDALVERGSRRSTRSSEEGRRMQRFFFAGAAEARARQAGARRPAGGAARAREARPRRRRRRRPRPPRDLGSRRLARELARGRRERGRCCRTSCQPSATDHVPVLADEVRASPRRAAGRDRRRRHLRRRRPRRAARRRPAAAAAS